MDFQDWTNTYQISMNSAFLKNQQQKTVYRKTNKGNTHVKVICIILLSHPIIEKIIGFGLLKRRYTIIIFNT